MSRSKNTERDSNKKLFGKKKMKAYLKDDAEGAKSIIIKKKKNKKIVLKDTNRNKKKGARQQADTEIRKALND